MGGSLESCIAKVWPESSHSARRNTSKEAAVALLSFKRAETSVRPSGEKNSLTSAEGA